jgi:hypothetical protein
LPVHRLSHEKRGNVYARREELAAWWESRRRTLAAEPDTTGKESALGLPRLERVTMTSAMTAWPALSSDGRLIAFVSDGGTDGARPQVWALDFTTAVYSAMAFPPKDPEKAKDDRQGVVRLGYIRRGRAVDIKSHVVKKANCPEGWFELVAGGYVCGKTVTTDPATKELVTAPHPPFAEGALPYEYGLNLTNGTPKSRRHAIFSMNLSATFGA